MTIAVDDDRSALADLTTDVLGRHCGLEHLRRCLDEGTAHTTHLWQRLADAGLLSVLVPEEQGGAGLDTSYLSGVLFKLGEYAVPEPFLETAVIAAGTLAAFPDSATATVWSERIASGEALVAVRIGALTPYVVHAADADLLLDLGDDGSVRAYPAGAFTVTPVRALDPLRPMGRVETTGSGELLGTSTEVVERARVLAVAGSACLLAGASKRLLDQTIEYVTVRHQFGRAVGSFQAVKHAIATMAVMVDMATSAAIGAFDAAGDPDAYSRARAAKAYAGDAADLANVEALQLHGGIGFTWEYHLHLWLKRVMSLASTYGTTGALRRELARELLTRVGEQGR